MDKPTRGSFEDKASRHFLADRGIDPRGVKVIIAGSRDITDYNKIERIVDQSGFYIEEVVSGCARGVDKLGERWAREHGVDIKRFPANWSKHGRSAGPLRNDQMARYADAAIVIHHNSPGSLNMCATMRHYGKPVEEHVIGN